MDKYDYYCDHCEGYMTQEDVDKGDDDRCPTVKEVVILFPEKLFEELTKKAHETQNQERPRS